MNRPSKTPDPDSLRNRALGYLARREHSRAGLTRKLEAAGYDAEAIPPLLDQFEEKGWLSDRRFAESWVADHRARAGSVKLAYDLRQRGVSDDIIDAVIHNARESELDRAREVWQKKFGSPPANAAEKARQMRFMLSRGFIPEVIRRVIADRYDCQSGLSE